MNIIKKFIDSKKEEYRKADEDNLRAEFKIVEKGGFLWLTHRGVAFLKVDNNAMVKDIPNELEKVRNTAVEYEAL